MLTKDELTAAVTRVAKTVDVPHVGKIGVRPMTAAEYYQWSDADRSADDDRTAMCRLVACSACDPAGVLLFDGDPEAVRRTLSARAVLDLFRAAMALNRMTDDAAEDDAKNS